MQESSPARLYALVIGGVLVIVGIVGFFYESSFETGSLAPRGDAFGILTVNGWHNLLHIATGLLGLTAAGYAARVYALGLGAVYVVVAILGFVAGSGDEILNLIVVNTEDNFLHLIIGVSGILAGIATPASSGSAPRRTSPAT